MNFNTIMNFIGPKVDFILDRWYFLLIAIALLSVVAISLNIFGLLFFAVLGTFVGMYFKWDLQRQQEEEYQQ